MRGPFVANILESNRQARTSWRRVAPHRARVTGLLASLGGGGSLCLLGAGRLTDVELEPLLARYRSIDLVDIDPASVRDGLARQNLLECDAVRRHAPLDLTGVLEHLPVAGEGAQDVPADRVADRLVDLLGRHRSRVPGAPFDVTASTGVLTQLLQAVVESSLEGDAADRVALALRDKHLADLVALTREHGSLVLVTDVVSTTSAPHLSTMAADRLEEAMSHLIAAQNFFTGTNPYRICELLSRMREVSGVDLEPPWLWPVTEDRSHLTYAVVARR